MTITASPLTVTRKNAAVSASAWFHTTDPGEFAVDYPDGITGPLTVQAAGSRAWGNMGSGGDYLARIGAEGADREDVTWLFDVDLTRLPSSSSGATYNYAITPLMLSCRIDGADRVNWNFYFRRYLSGTNRTFSLVVSDSLNSGQNTALYLSYNKVLADIPTSQKFALTKAAGGAYALHWGTRGAVVSGTRNSTGTMGGTEALIWQQGISCAKIQHVCSDAELDAWFANGTIPATDREFVFPGGQEIDSAAPVIYDVSGNAYDLTATQITNWQAPGMRGDFTDTGFTSPLVEVPITIAADCAAGTHNITLRRTRVGIPTRVPALPDAVLYDEGTIPVTVAVTAEAVTIGPDIDCQVPSYPTTVDLIVTSNYDGDATVESDDPAITPTSPVTIANGAVVCPCTVTGDVTGATLTVTGPGGDTDTASVTISEVPEPAETLEIGPDVTVAAATYPCVVDLMITSNTDGVVNLASDNANLEVDATATVSGGVVEIEALALADVTGAVITASRPSGASDTCTVTTVEDLPEEWIAVGPNQRTRLANARVLWPIRVRSSADGEFTATAEPADGLTISGPFVITGGACDFTAQPTKAGTWILTVTQDGRTDSVTLEALAPAAAPTVRQYNLSAEIDGFFDFINRKYGLRPRFTASSVQDVRAEHATDRTYSRYAQGTGQPGSVFGAVALSYQVMISYSSAVMAEQDLGMLREEADRYSWEAIGFSFVGQTMFEPIKMQPRLNLTLNFDILPQVR